MIAFIDDHRWAYGVEPICNVLPIAPSTYHEHVAKRTDPWKLSARAKRDLELKPQIERIFGENFEVYGARKVWWQMLCEGFDVARCTVERLMADLGLQGVIRGKPSARLFRTRPRRVRWTMSTGCSHAPAPNMLWVWDFTYVSTWSGFVYLAFVIDAHARRIVGWRGARTAYASFVLERWSRPCTSADLYTAVGWCIIRIAVRKADSTGRRNILSEEVVMKKPKRRSDRAGRAPLHSPGRPPVAGRGERRAFWAAIAAGVSSEEAAAAAGIPQAVGARWFRKAGGMAPAMYKLWAKPLSGRYLSLAEREDIALMRVQGCSIRAIARQLRRSASTISRELRRNAATRSGGLEYRATTAQWHAERSARRPKPAKLAAHATLRTYVQERLAGLVVAPNGAAIVGPMVSWKGRRHGQRQERRWARAWSPEQIARRLPLDFPNDPTMRVSHEAIYQALFIQGRGALRRELTACLRSGRVLRVPRARTGGRGKGLVSPEIMISERPAEADDRAIPGHWRRSDPRPQPVGDRHAGGAQHALHHAAASAAHARLWRGATGEERAAARGAWRAGSTRGDHPHDDRFTRPVTAVANLGSRLRDGRACQAQDRCRPAGLFLRSPEPMAARDKRKHQWAPATILPERHRLEHARPRRDRCGGCGSQHEATQDARLADTSRSP